MMTDEISSSNVSNFGETNFPATREPTGNAGEDEENWFYERQRTEENSENNPTETIDDVNEQEMESRADPPMSSGLSVDQLDDDSDDEDNIQVTIGPIQTAPTIFPNRQLSRQSNPPPPTMPMKNQPHRGVDLDAQGTINGQPTYEHDLTTAYKDDEKPWKKPGADITDYFNYGFTEETWAAYCDRQRRLRSENNTARLNANQIPPMAPMIPGPIPMMHPMNPLPVVAMHKPPMNVQMIPQRPYINPRKPDGKIDVIGGTDMTSRRTMYEMQNNFDHPTFLNGPQFSAGQPPNGQTVGDLVSTPPASNGPPTPHGTPTGANHAIPTLGGHRMPMIPPPGMQFRPPFGHPHVPGGPGFFPHGPGGPMHGERPPGPYFMSPHPQQTWDKPGVPPGHGFPPGHFPPPNVAPGNTGNGRPGPSSRSSTPEDQSSRSSTPEENRPGTSNTGGDNDKTSKDDRYKERYRDDRDRHLSSHRRSSPGKDRSSSSYRSSRHRSGDHEYERPRSDRKSSRDRDDKYERYSRKRHHRDESGRHHRSGASGPDDDSSRSHRSRRTPTKNFSSPPKTNSHDPTQSSIDNVEGIENNGSSSTPTISGTASGSPTGSRSRREGSSSRHSHHKKSSKRSRRDDSGDERSHHRRRSKDKSSSSKKSSSSSSNINAVDSSTVDGKDQQQQQLSND